MWLPMKLASPLHLLVLCSDTDLPCILAVLPVDDLGMDLACLLLLERSRSHFGADINPEDYIIVTLRVNFN